MQTSLIALPNVSPCLPETQGGQHKDVKAAPSFRFIPFSRNNGKPKIGLLNLEGDVTELRGSMSMSVAFCTTGVF